LPAAVAHDAILGQLLLFALVATLTTPGVWPQLVLRSNLRRIH
jgi:hypothetical protein